MLKYNVVLNSYHYYKERKVNVRLFPTKNAFRVYAALASLLNETGHCKGILIPEIATKAHISYGSAYYWVKVLNALFGFIVIEREKRKTSDTKQRVQIVIRWNSRKKFADLEKLVNCDRWFMDFVAACNPPLPKSWPLPKE